MSSLFKSLPFKAFLAVVLTVACVVLGVTFATPSHHDSADPLTERLASVDTATLTVRRAAFCSRVPAATVAAALGAPARTAASWRPGQTMQIGNKVNDVVDEYGCSWATASGAVARAWVFAPPIAHARAKALAKAVPSGCRPLTASPIPTSPAATSPTATASPTGSPSPASSATATPGWAYGSPTSALTCGDGIMLRGLFGDAWLTCELPSTDVDLAGRWCLAVARAAG